MKKGFVICPDCQRARYVDASLDAVGYAYCLFCKEIFKIQKVHVFVADAWKTGPPPAKGQRQRYPGRFWYNFKRVYPIPDHSKILHMFSGSMDWGDTTDIRAETGAKYVAPYNDLPIPDENYKLVIGDPPYTHGFSNRWTKHPDHLPKPKWILIEASRVTEEDGLIALLHVIIIPAYKVAHVERIALHAILTGPNNAVRVLNVFRKKKVN